MRSDALVSQLVFGDAHELSGRGGGFEAGDGGELVVVDLGSVWVLACCSSGEDVVWDRMEVDVVYLWLGFEALPLLLCVSWLMQNAR